VTKILVQFDCPVFGKYAVYITATNRLGFRWSTCLSGAFIVTCYSGGMTGMPYSLPRSSDYLDEQKMDVVNDTGVLT